MKNILILFFFFSSFFPAFGQHDSDFPILTQSENEAWVQDFVSTKDLASRLQKLKSRLKVDLGVFYIVTGNPHGKTKIDERYGGNTRYRPLYIFTAEGSAPALFPANPSEKAIDQISEVLIPENVASMEFPEGTMAAALYGSRANSGVIKVILKEKEDLEQVKQILQQEVAR